ncbi:MAG: 5-formyltetrahydrofolate cyclo-ligase [Clostridiales Family XIII bacterium]|jgi:5-formyltetrahydrofolate cyclo-ligase|nr:5-formyltetrahydrofolate cyclo-ligase [Clostridiales Family XIII bacterium]
MSEKSGFRKKMIERRGSIDAAVRAEAGQNILAAVKSISEYLAASVIFCYVSTADEPDTRALIKYSLIQSKRVCVPLCLPEGNMQVREIIGLDDLQVGKYDISEPKPSCPLVLPEDIDLIVVPCVCCDKDGYRLGYGGGFYDRWLEKRRAPAAVLCYESMMVPSVPREPHDQRADILITDRRITVNSGPFAMRA